MIKIEPNLKSVTVKVDEKKEFLELKLKALLEDLAKDLVARTPVVTGAFAESFSVVPSSSGGGRSRSSKGRPKGDLVTFREIATSNMVGDISRLDLKETKSISFRNRAPHAEPVEKKYEVFGAVKDKNR